MDISSGRPVVVFDLDGTLVDVAARDYAVYRDVLVDNGLTPLPIERYWPLRRERTELAALLAHSVPSAVSYVPEFVARRGERYELSRYLALDAVFPDVPGTLTTLRQRYACVLITSRKDPLATGRQLEALGLDAYFDAVHVADNDKASVVRTLAGIVMIVGDTEHDIRLAAEHAHPSFAVTTGIRSRRLLADAGPTHLADCLADLVTILCPPEGEASQL